MESSPKESKTNYTILLVWLPSLMGPQRCVVSAEPLFTPLLAKDVPNFSSKILQNRLITRYKNVYFELTRRFRLVIFYKYLVI